MSQPGLCEDPLDSEHEYGRQRRLFWLIFPSWIVVLAFTVWLVSWRTGGPKLNTNQPLLLQGAPQFIVLSLVVVFAAYLRQVSAGAVELRSKIRGGEVWNYPPDRGYRYVADKMEALGNTVYSLSLAAPFLISLAILAAVRIVLDGASRFGAGKIPRLLYHMDLAIAIWLLVLFSVLALVHSLARAEDERIQFEARKKEPEILKERAKRQDGNQTTSHESPNPATASQLQRGGAVHEGTLFVILATLFWFITRMRKK